MNDYQVVVHPFREEKNSFPARYVTPNQKSDPPIRLQLGRNGNGKTMGGHYSSTISYYVVQHIVEKKKKPT